MSGEIINKTSQRKKQDHIHTTRQKKKKPKKQSFITITYTDIVIKLGVGVSMFDQTRKHDMNQTQVFLGQGWVLMGLGHKWVNLKATR